jgi:hypothetical protein
MKMNSHYVSKNDSRSNFASVVVCPLLLRSSQSKQRTLSFKCCDVFATPREASVEESYCIENVTMNIAEAILKIRFVPSGQAPARCKMITVVVMKCENVCRVYIL